MVDPGDEIADGVGDELVDGVDVVVVVVEEFDDPEVWLDAGGTAAGTDPCGILAASPSTEALTVELV